MMTKKIFIFENSNSAHEEGIETVVKILNKLDYKIYLCLNKISIFRIKEFKLDNYIEDIIDISNIIGIFKVLKLMKSCDLAFYNTISARNSFMLFMLSFLIKNNIYAVKNCNSWIKYSNHKGTFINKLVRFLSYKMKNNMMKRSYFMVVANTNTKKYLSLHTKKNIEVIPYKYFDEKKVAVDKSNYITFVVPGGIDLNRKPLFDIKNASSMLSVDELKNIQIILLGKPKNKTDELFCKEWKDDIGESLKYYNSFVSVQEYEYVLSHSTFILSNFNINFEDKYVKEIYGKTKDSGVDAQSICYGKPLIVNTGFIVVKEIVSSTTYYSNAEELYKIFSNIISNKNKNLENIAFHNSMKFTIDRIAKNIKEF